MRWPQNPGSIGDSHLWKPPKPAVKVRVKSHGELFCVLSQKKIKRSKVTCTTIASHAEPDYTLWNRLTTGQAVMQRLHSVPWSWGYAKRLQSDIG